MAWPMPLSLREKINTVADIRGSVGIPWVGVIALAVSAYKILNLICVVFSRNKRLHCGRKLQRHARGNNADVTQHRTNTQQVPTTHCLPLLFLLSFIPTQKGRESANNGTQTSQSVRVVATATRNNKRGHQTLRRQTCQPWDSPRVPDIHFGRRLSLTSKSPAIVSNK